MAGCRVQLVFQRQESDKWSGQGTVRCGLDENAAERSFRTGSYGTRDEVEEEALRRVADLLGNNVDRNTSRVNNWS